MKIGILIIGSLWWRKGIRESWRTNRLAVANAVSVKAPIHYGRLSSSRTYTMTFSPEKIDGTALVVPCLIEGDLLTLIREAEELWGAEANHATVAGRISTDWGCVGAGFKSECLAEERAAWTEYFRSCGCKALAAVDANGMLTIPWPQRVDGQPLDLDVLLAASNVESPPAKPEAIAAAWIKHGNDDYFFKNVAADIRTPDDGAIWRKMAGEFAWVTSRNPKFSPVIERLRGEFPTNKGANVRSFAPERWGAIERFAHLYRSTYTLPPKIHGCVVGADGQFERATLLRDIALDLIPSLQLDRAELDAAGHTHAENSRKLTAVIESAITALYSSLDCGRQVITHVFAKCRGLPDSTRKTFQRAAKGELDPALPPRILKAFADAPWYPDLRYLRDALTHGGPGSCHRDEQTGKVMYFHNAVRGQYQTHLPDVFAVLDESLRHVNLFHGQIFTALLETLKDDEVEQICGFFEGLVYMRKVRPSEAKDIHSGRCESHVWFDQPGQARCPLASTCGAYRRRLF